MPSSVLATGIAPSFGVFDSCVEQSSESLVVGRPASSDGSQVFRSSRDSWAAGPSTGESRQGLTDLDDVGGEHVARLGAEVRCVVRRAGRDEKALAGWQGQRGLTLDLHFDRTRED